MEELHFIMLVVGNHVAIKKLLQHPEINLTLVDSYGDTPLFLTIFDLKMFIRMRQLLNLLVVI
jgi:hypothetical protein